MTLLVTKVQRKLIKFNVTIMDRKEILTLAEHPLNYGLTLKVIYIKIALLLYL